MTKVDAVTQLIREAVEVAEYGLGRDGCPFCGSNNLHARECIAKVFGARDYDEVHPGGPDGDDTPGFPFSAEQAQEAWSQLARDLSKS